MKTVILMRHAKSSWNNHDLKDFDRPLNERGKADVPKIGARLKLHHIRPDLIVCSSAKRTVKTARAVADVLKYSRDKILDEERLYGASYDMIIERLQQIPESAETVIYVGHNPGITNAVNVLGNARIDNMPTSGVACYNFDISNWEDLAPGTGVIQFLEFPRMFD